ncbi:hypothetical protein BJQ96_02757 [Flavobacterium sp. PL0002]|nr:hypothetical protein [Flavobacterium sp. PL002]
MDILKIGIIIASVLLLAVILFIIFTQPLVYDIKPDPIVYNANQGLKIKFNHIPILPTKTFQEIETFFLCLIFPKQSQSHSQKKSYSHLITK